MKNEFLALAALLLVSFLPARADMAPDPVTGGITIHLRSKKPTTDISMLSEKVTMDIYRDRVETRATFNLTNTGSRTMLDVGFPHYSMNQWSEAPELSDFKANVDGKPMEVTSDIVTKVLGKDTSTPGKPISTTWSIWKMQFNAGESKRVDVSYHTPLKKVDMMIQDDVGIGGGEYYTSLVESFNLREAIYLLYSGSYWKGPIKTCDVIVKFHDSLSVANVIACSSPPTSKAANEFTWHLTNLYDYETQKKQRKEFVGALIPQVSVTFSLDNTLPQVIAGVAAFRKKHPDDIELLKYHQCLLCLAGRKKEALSVIAEYLTKEKGNILKEKRRIYKYTSTLLKAFKLIDETKSADVEKSFKASAKPLLLAALKDRQRPNSWHDEFTKRDDQRIKELIARCSK